MAQKNSTAILIGLLALPNICFAQQGNTVTDKKIDQSVTSHNQSGGITAHTVVVGPQRLAFDVAIATDLAQKIPKNVPIDLWSVGSQTDHAIADRYGTYLLSQGFQIANRNLAGMVSPPPENKISIAVGGPRTTITIAPNAN